MYVSSPDYEIGDKLVASILDFQVAANVIVIHLGWEDIYFSLKVVISFIRLDKLLDT